MRNLSATLLAAQQQPSGRPYVRAVLSDFHGDVSRIRFGRHYTGAEGEYFSATVGAGDGSLIRARIDPVTKVLYTQRVTAPGPGSSFSSWTSHGAVSASGAVALAGHGSSVFLFFVDADTVRLRVKESSDNGASYDSASTIATAATAVTYLAAAIADGGDRVLLWSVGAVVWKSRYAAGSWGTPAAWSNSVASITGLACKYRFDWDVVICGTATTSGDAKVWTCLYGDGGVQTADTWSSLKELTTATATTNVSFLSPALELLQSWRLFFVEKYTGSQAYSRLQWTTMPGVNDFKQELWREPVAFDYSGDYGIACTARNQGGYLWLSSPAGVWSGLSPGYAELDVSADVVEATVQLDEDGGRVRVVLANPSTGNAPALRYSGPGAGALGVLRRGARLELAPGYHTTAGAEVLTGDAYWVESIEMTTGAEPRVVIRARDVWWLLEQWRARRQFAWVSGEKTVSQILAFVCARAGAGYASVSSSDAITTYEPAFTIHPGESGRTAVRRLLATVPDEAFARGATLTSVYPQPDDEPEYAYGAGHAIVAARYRDVGAVANRARVLGAGAFNEAFDFGEIESVGERIEQVLDLNLTTATLTGERAALELRRSELRERSDEVLVSGVNCGQELYDVVAISDPQAGLEEAPRRVLGLTWRYIAHPSTGSGRTGGGRYDMTLVLGSP
jgi:hypothetical protein